MTLTEKSIKNFRNKPQKNIWNYVTALQQLQNALFELEKDEKNPDILKDISTRALEIGEEIEAILNILEMEEEK